MPKESAIRAPGSIEGQAAKTKESVLKIAEGRIKREKEKSLSQSIQESLDDILAESGADEQTQKEYRARMENPLIKKALIESAVKMDLRHGEMSKLVQQVLEQKDSIAQKIAERQKNINSLKGKLTYWKGQAKKMEAQGNIKTDLPKQVKEFTDVHNRIDELTKQIRKAEKSGLDLDLTTNEQILDSLPKKALKGKNRENTNQESFSPEIRQQILDAGREASEAKNELADLVHPGSNDDDEEFGFEVPVAKEPVVMEKTRAIKKPDAMDKTAVDHQNSLQYESVPDPILVIGESSIGDQNLEEQSMPRLELKKSGDQYVIELPDSKMNIEVGTDKTFAENLFAYAKQEASVMGDEDETNIMDRIAFVLQNEKSKNTTKKKTRFENGMPGFGEFIHPTQDALSYEPPPIPEDYEPVKLTEMTTEKPATEKKSESEWWNQSGNEQFTGAWNAVNKEIGVDAAVSTLLSLGAPKNILKKYKTPQALYQFIEEPGFWARINGDADATREAMNRFIESAAATGKKGAKVVSKSAESAASSMKKTYGEKPKGLV